MYGSCFQKASLILKFFLSFVMIDISVSERKFIQDGISQGLRNDGRGREDYRPLDIHTGIISQANGSARVKLGGTQLLASIKAELGSPLESNPNAGRLEISVECSPTAAPEYKGQGGDELSSELARAIERCFVGIPTGSPAIDLSSLSIAEGKLCWVLYMDALILSMDGSLLDALGIGFKAALSDLHLPKVNFISGTDVEEEGDFEIVDDIDESSKIDTNRVPLIVTLIKVGKEFIVDASSHEEGLAGISLSVAVTSSGQICGVIKRESASLDSVLLLDMLSTASRIGKQLHRKVDALVDQSKHAMLT